MAKVEWHPGELHPRVGFIVTNMPRPVERVVMFYNQRGTAEQHIKEGKIAVTWTRLSCHRFAANAVRLQLHALACNLANFLRTLTLPAAVSHWSMTTLRDRLVKIGAKIVRHGRSIIFQMAAVMVPRALFQTILSAIAALRPLLPARCQRISVRLGRSGWRLEACVPSQACVPRFLPPRRSSTSRQGSSSLPGVSPLPDGRFVGYRAFVAAKVAVHRGNPG